MMKMDVIEVYKDTAFYYKAEKVIWGMTDYEIELIWQNKAIYFTKRFKKPSKEQRKNIRKTNEWLDMTYKRRMYDRFIKIYSLYMDVNGDIYFVTVYMRDGVLIWINKMDERIPSYFFNYTINHKK